MSDLTKYVPEFIPYSEDMAYGKMLVKLNKCSTCGCWTLDKAADQGIWNKVFPAWFAITIRQQMAKAGWRFSSDVKRDDEIICSKCAEEGRGGFTCSLCKEYRTSDQEEEAFGDPPDYLCTICYETVSAKVWHDKYNSLFDAHKYDFE
jgi:hypothetical protein